MMKSEVGPAEVQGEPEVGVRLVLDAGHKADELAHVAFLPSVQTAPGRRRRRHTCGAPAVLREVRVSLFLIPEIQGHISFYSL